MNILAENYLDIWIGLAKVTSQNKKILQGAKNAFVQVIAHSHSKQVFRKKVAQALDEMGIKLIRLEDVEVFNKRIKKFEVDSKLLDLADDIVNNKAEICFGAFHTYD